MVSDRLNLHFESYSAQRATKIGHEFGTGNPGSFAKGRAGVQLEIGGPFHGESQNPMELFFRRARLYLRR